MGQAPCTQTQYHEVYSLWHTTIASWNLPHLVSWHCTMGLSPSLAFGYVRYGKAGKSSSDLNMGQSSCPLMHCPNALKKVPLAQKWVKGTVPKYIKKGSSNPEVGQRNRPQIHSFTYTQAPCRSASREASAHSRCAEACLPGSSSPPVPTCRSLRSHRRHTRDRASDSMDPPGLIHTW